MKLTFTQLKQIASNGHDIREAVEKLNDIPVWASLDSISEIQSIIQSGCAANAHISCFYYQAKEIFLANSTEIEEALTEALNSWGTVSPWDIENETFDQYVSRLLQIAVEYTASQFAGILDGVDRD